MFRGNCHPGGVLLHHCWRAPEPGSAAPCSAVSPVLSTHKTQTSIMPASKWTRYMQASYVSQEQRGNRSVTDWGGGGKSHLLRIRGFLLFSLTLVSCFLGLLSLFLACPCSDSMLKADWRLDFFLLVCLLSHGRHLEQLSSGVTWPDDISHVLLNACEGAEHRWS